MSEFDEPSTKKHKPSLDGDSTQENGKSMATVQRFSGFSLDRVLSDRAQTKVMCVAGRFAGSDDHAVVILEKTPFTKENVQKMLSDSTPTEVTLQNDIYSTFQCKASPDLNIVKATLIYPATKKHIEKNTSQEICMISESPEDYKKITLPYIKGNQFSTQWVYNILEKKHEADRIVFEDADPDTGFILLPDMKWDGLQVEDLYLVAIVHTRSLCSIRDLTDQHLPLLCNIRDKGTAVIKEKYGVGSDKLRVYLHYQPSYYHLHVHFTHLGFDAPGSSVGRAVLLQDVITNIKVASDFYSKAALCFTTAVNAPLALQFAEARDVKHDQMNTEADASPT